MMLHFNKRSRSFVLLAVPHALRGLGRQMTGTTPLSGLCRPPRLFARKPPQRWLALALLFLTVSVPVLAQGDGVIEGRVVNGSSGGEDIGAGIIVTMRALRNDAIVDEFETRTDDGGGFRFEGLDTDPELEYWPETTYLDVPYTLLEPLQFGADQMAPDATITVHETTQEDSAISLDALHMIAESFGEVLRVTEIHLYGNSGDRTYVGRAGDAAPEIPTTVRIPLPDNGVGLALEQSETEPRYVEVEGAVLDTAPVRPGSETSLVFFSYHLMVTGDVVPLERRFAYAVADMNALVAQPDLSLRSEQLQSLGAETFQDRQYNLYVGSGLAAGDALIIEFLPVAGEGAASMPSGAETTAQTVTTGQTRGNQELLRWLGFLLVAVAAMGALVYPLVTTRQTVTPEGRPVGQTSASRRLVSELADLHDEYEAGRLDEEEYARRRDELVEAIKRLQR